MVKNNETIYSNLFDICNVVFLLLFSLSILYPFMSVISISLSSPEAVARTIVKLVPVDFNITAYRFVFSSNNVLIAYKNSIVYTVLTVVFTLLVGCLAAYPLAHKKFKARGFVALYFTITMFFGGGMIPMLLLIRELQMYDTVWAMTLPSAFSFWYIILLRTNFQSLPDGLDESARIDGANDWQILLRIVIPLSVPILVTIALFTSVAKWNDFFNALLFLQSQEKMPLTMILRNIIVLQQNPTGDMSLFWGPERSAFFKSVQMATIVVTIGPIILVYPFAQKYFFQGKLVGAIKG